MSKAKLCSMDWETAYDPATGYTLKKITGEEYIRSPLFESLCVGVKFEGEKEYAVRQEDLERFFTELRKHQDKLAVIHHHGQFDALISSHHFNFRPKLLLCTLSMARALNFPRDFSLSLESLSKHYGILPKTVPYHLFQGKRWSGMDDGLKKLMLDGAARDALNAEEICNRLLPLFPREELVSIDWTIRAYSEPQLIGYAQEFEEIARNEEQRKADLLRSLGLTKDLLTSNAKFAEILEALGVEVEKKANSKGQMIPAVAKSDSFMKDLLNSEDETVKLLAETRLAVKSSIRETRAGRMADMSSRGMMAVYYYFCGAQNTTRHSGGDKFNWQNLERKGPMRKAIAAPKGKKLIIVDKSQIECRILNAASGQEDVVERFRSGEDIYCYNASMLYGFPVNKKDHPTERGTGKQIELSCLGPNTLCLTERGWTAITDVTLNDRLWDGEAWVTHAGVVERGRKSVIDLGGAWMTPDHRILCGASWRLRSSVTGDTLSQALETGLASLPSRGTSSPSRADLKLSLFGATAGRRSMRLTRTTSGRGALPGVTRALNWLRGSIRKTTAGTQTSYPMTPCVEVYLGESQTASSGATTQTHRTTTHMAVGGYKYTSHGVKTGGRFSRISLRLKAMITLSYSSTGKIIAKGMNRAILGSLRRKPITTIAALYSFLKRRLRNSKLKTPDYAHTLMTYDIAYVGPQNRFLILSSYGPLVVHNCGYGCGAAKFVTTAALGIYGPVVKLELQEALQAVTLYRNSHPEVVRQWKAGDYILDQWNKEGHAGTEYKLMGVTYKDGYAILPSGLRLDYTTTTYDNKLRQYFFHHKKSFARNVSTTIPEGEAERWEWWYRRGFRTLYGAKMVEQLTQALSAVDYRQSCNRVYLKYGLRPAMSSHDEAVFVVDSGEAAAYAEKIEKEFSTPPKWLPNLPSACEIIIDERYSK